MSRVTSPLFRPIEALTPVIEAYTPHTRREFLQSYVNPPKSIILPNGTEYVFIDHTSTFFIRLFKAISDTKPHIVKDTDTLPFVSNDYYQTTSLWWLIGLYNGVEHGYAIRPGDRWEIPSLSQILAFLALQLERDVKKIQREIVL